MPLRAPIRTGCVGNNADAFPDDQSETLDTDADGIGNNNDTDDDGDGVPDAVDAFPLLSLTVGNETLIDANEKVPDAVTANCDEACIEANGMRLIGFR